MITEDKIIEFFCLEDDSCQFFDKYKEIFDWIIHSDKEKYHRDRRMNIAEIIVMIMFHSSSN